MQYTIPEDTMKVKDFPAFMRGFIKELIADQESRAIIDCGDTADIPNIISADDVAYPMNTFCLSSTEPSGYDIWIEE